MKWFQPRARSEKLRVLFELYSERVRAAAFFVVRDNSLAEDIMQETFITALEKLDQLKDPERIEAWLVRIAINKSKDACRNNAKVVTLTNDIAVPDTSHERLILDAEVALALEAVAQLSVDHQVILYFKYVRGLSVEQVARALDIPEGTVKSRLQRAREAARSYFSRKEGLI